MTIATTEEILDFWFSDEVRQKWFAKDEEFDKEIKKRFLATYKDAKGKRSYKLGDSPEEALARVIVLDQFPRNMFRGTSEAFETDKYALAASSEAVRRKYDRFLNNDQKKFLYMPFLHSEDLKDQRTSIALYSRVNDENSLTFAHRHKEIILRFKRFPHRNEPLGRQTTKEEEVFLREPCPVF